MGAFEPINRVFEPIMAPLRYMPISAFIPLLILWFGIYEKQKIAFLFLGVFVYLLPVVISAIRAVHRALMVPGENFLSSSRATIWSVARSKTRSAPDWSPTSNCSPPAQKATAPLIVSARTVRDRLVANHVDSSIQIQH